MTSLGEVRVSRSPEALARSTRAALIGGNALLSESASLLPALVAQLEQAIGAGALPREVVPLVGQARRLAARIAASRAAAHGILRYWEA
jgi:hypothetical protein